MPDAIVPKKKPAKRALAAKLRDLREHLGQVADIHAAVALLEWDQETYMPSKAGPGRGLQLATLSALGHRLHTDRALGRLLHHLRDNASQLEPDEAKLVSETLYDYERATRLPESFVHQFAQEQSNAYHAWVKARQDSAFGLFQPHLAKIVDLLKQKADLLGYEGSPYNALLESFERGMTAEQLRPLFATLSDRQTALVRRIAGSGKPLDATWLDQSWSEQAQWDVSLRILRDMGYDFDAGRQDRSVHPFTTGLGLRDVRVTTRTTPQSLFSGILGSIHEGGHALYEQGHAEHDARTPLAEAPSLGMHESQSRLWENVIGRSRPFWTHYLPLMRRHFPGQLDAVTPQQVFEAVNEVRPSLIRVEADECTYNLHVILRFEIEIGLLEGHFAVRDVPEIWNAKIREYLGVAVPNDAQGCLQDIHWSHGAFGYFPTYTLGNLYAAQFLEAILRQIPDLWQQVAAGELRPLREWLRENIHQHGRRKTAREFLRDLTNAEPQPEPFLRYLEDKYSQLYALQ